MKKETLEKIRNILEHLFEIFIFILIMLITFGSLSVHAAEANSFVLNTFKGDYKYSYSNTNTASNNYRECFTGYLHFTDKKFYAFVYDTETNASFGIFRLFYYDSGSGKVRVYQNDTKSTYNFPSGFKDESAYFNIYYVDQESNKKWAHNYICTFFVQSYNTDPEFSSDLMIFNSESSMLSYCQAGDTSGLLNGGSIDNPDFEDTAYSFTGFTANNKMTASWTGTTERSYLQDQEVEEYVRVNYYFADKETQDTIKQADAYPDEFATADKTLTIDVSGLKPDDENWFLRYIRITPCYRQAGLGAWGDFYHGEPSYVYFSQDGSIDRIDAPYIKGELSSDMERPVIVLHEAANGNPTESDYSYFEFNNAQSDYFFEMKGRWYTTNDFDLYRDKLVWKYKYSTLLKNNLSTWVSVSDNRSSVGRFQFDVLGKSSWDNLLSSYPVDDRNYIGGSYNLFNKITGYSDALETLKMLLKQPYSLFNGYEVYVRYFRYDENGGIQYSKWTHFYNNLADSDGSSGSRLDDLDNMYSENQSDKGLTDDELFDLENGGNSRNDLDAVPKNNYDYSSLENATMNFFDLLKNFGTMLGQFPSMVAAVFGFLPPWLIGLIAVAIGAVIVCRFIGR
nr:MAG TPA: hypothetical protein [Inoviridae sp.]